MINFAELDENNNVINVIVATNASITQIQGTFIKCSDVDGEVSIGGHYNKDNNKFVQPKPFPSWTLNENLDWESPLGDKPVKEGSIYAWNEESGAWDEFEKVNIDL
jgi:hypothetical protein